MSERGRRRFLDYLPALYHETDEASFLATFLQPFEAVFGSFEETLAQIDSLFAPALSPEADFLPWLAGWVALVLDESWDEAKRRQLIAEAVELYRWRGTVKGLKRYLEIYTGLAPEIRECRWPAGMQIGVASQIGVFDPAEPGPTRIASTARQPHVLHDYYVVDAPAPPGHAHVPAGQSLRYYYRADRVKQVEVADNAVDIWRFLADDSPAQKNHHEPAAITRRDGLLHDQYLINEDSAQPYTFTGNSFLIDEVELPWRFIVDVRVHPSERDKVEIDKIRAIVDLEKPAHTLYYLRITPIDDIAEWQRMQIEVRSTIGVDAIPG